MFDVLRTLFRTSFTRLSLVKRWLMRLAFLGVLVGGSARLLDGSDHVTLGGVDVGHLGLTSGVGFISGFLVGATVRLFLKVAFWLGVAFVALGYGLSHLGWIDLPWSSFGHAMSDVGAAVEKQAESVKAFLTGLAPAGGALAVGIGSGMTQKPRFDDDAD